MAKAVQQAVRDSPAVPKAWEEITDLKLSRKAGWDQAGDEKWISLRMCRPGRDRKEGNNKRKRGRRMSEKACNAQSGNAKLSHDQ